jgi:AcrR family transcriptional regulator
MSSGLRDTRVAVLDAARALFESTGYHGTGLESVAKRAGVSRQAIYLHFSSKADLLRALHERINEQDVEPPFRAVWSADTVEQALDAWVAASAEAIPKFIVIASALNAARRFDADVEATWEAPKHSHYDDCKRLARRLGSERRLAKGVTVADAADILWNLTGIWSYESLVQDRGWSVQRWSRWVGELLRQQLLGADVRRPA